MVPKVTLAMIVKDEEHYLSLILPIVRPCFDDAVAVDAGSIDRTRRILKEHGFRVVDRPWTNNYAEARNAALKEVKTDWVVMLDADEAMFPSDIECLKREWMPKSNEGFIVLPRYNFILDHEHYEPRAYPDVQGRVLRAGMGYHFRNRVHEIAFRGEDKQSSLEKGYGAFAKGIHLFHYGMCKLREEIWLRHHNYTRLSRGESPIRIPPKPLEDSSKKEYPKFMGDHPLRGMPVQVAGVKPWEVAAKADPIEGWMSLDELFWLAKAASTKSTVIEVGSWKGRSTKALGGWVAGKVYAVDHWLGSENERSGPHHEATLPGDRVYNEFLRNLGPEIRAGKVIPMRGESSETARKLREMLPEGVDLVFIDGDHRYERVRRDIEEYWPLVVRGGILAGHDYSPAFPGVIQAVDERFPVHHTFDSIWYVFKEN